MASTSLDQALAAYHSPSRLIDMSNLSPHSLNLRTSLSDDGYMLAAKNGDEAMGVREGPSCRELACEGERLIRNAEFEEAIPLLEQGLVMSLMMEVPDYNLVSVLWSLLGNAHYSLENHIVAAQCHIHDFALCRSRSDLLGMAQALCNLGNAYFRMGKFNRACHCYLVYLQTVQSMGDQRSIAKAYHNLGDLFQTIGYLLALGSRFLTSSGESCPTERAKLAKRYLKSALHYFELNLDYMLFLTDRVGLSRAYTNMAYNYSLLQDYDKAIDFYEKRLTLCKELQDAPSNGRTICSIGNCLQAMKQLDKSIDFYISALKVANELEDILGQAIVSGNLGNTYVLKGDHDHALESYKRELLLMIRIDNFRGQIKSLDSLWLAYEHSERYEDALRTLDQLIIMLKDVKDYENELRAVTLERDRLQQFLRMEKELARGKTKTSLMKRIKNSSIKQMFTRKDSNEHSVNLERSSISPKNTQTRSSYQGKEQKKRNSDEFRDGRRHLSLSDPKDFAEIKEALSKHKSKPSRSSSASTNDLLTETHKNRANTELQSTPKQSMQHGKQKTSKRSLPSPLPQLSKQSSTSPKNQYQALQNHLMQPNKEEQEATSPTVNKTTVNAQPLSEKSDDTIQEIAVIASTELLSLLYRIDDYPNTKELLSNNPTLINENNGDIYASYGYKTNHHAHFCLVKAVLSNLDKTGGVLVNEDELCTRGRAFLSQWNGWIVSDQLNINSSLLTVSAEVKQKESEMI